MDDLKSENPESPATETVNGDETPRPRPPSVAEGGTPVEGSALSQEELDELTNDIIKALKSVYDPEIPADIFELGLIYNIDISDAREVAILMTLTAPGCPVAGEMPGWVEGAVRGVEGVEDVTVNMVFEPPWTPERISPLIRSSLGL